MSDITGLLRAICKHDSRSVVGCVTCEGADEIDSFRELLHQHRAERDDLAAKLYGQEREIERLRPALRELVALHDLKASLPAWPHSPDPDREKRVDYARRKPLAWAAARKALDSLSSSDG